MPGLVPGTGSRPCFPKGGQGCQQKQVAVTAQRFEISGQLGHTCGVLYRTMHLYSHLVAHNHISHAGWGRHRPEQRDQASRAACRPGAHTHPSSTTTTRNPHAQTKTTVLRSPLHTQKEPELLSNTMSAKANACTHENGVLKSTLNLFSSTFPMRKLTSAESPSEG